jgi:signal transduction histidine kinase
LNKTKSLFILRQYRKNASKKWISLEAKVLRRRAQEIIKEYKETGLENLSCAKKLVSQLSPHDLMDSEIVRAAHAHYRLGVRMQ